MVTLTSLYCCSTKWLTIIQEICTRAQKQTPKPFSSMGWRNCKRRKGRWRNMTDCFKSKPLPLHFFYIPFFLTFAKYGLQAHDYIWKSRKRSCCNNLGLPGKRMKNKANDYPVCTSACVIQPCIHKEAEESLT